jgi:hypothetical protein
MGNPTGPRELKIPAQLVNEVTVEEDGQTYVYRAEFYQVYADGFDFRGSARVIKSRITRFVAFWASLFSGKRVERVASTQVYSIATKHQFKYILCSGQLTADRDGECGAWYRNSLKSKALNAGYHFSREFLEALFRPLDQKIWECYLELRK